MKSCILCSKNKHVTLYIEIEGIQIYVCKNCHLGYLDKLGLLEQKKLSGRIHYSLEEYLHEESKIRARFEKLASKVLMYKHSGELLDVGAGFGLFSSIFHKSGFSVTAVEPVNQLYYLNNLKSKIYRKTFERFFKFNKKKFDLILLIDIIEHLKNPLNSVQRMKNSLRNKGIVVIQTPNYKSLMARLCKRWSWWMIEDHKFFFTPESLNRLMSKAGYKVKMMSTYEGALDFKKNLDGNFTILKNPYFKKIVKVLYYFTFFPIYFFARKLIWKLGYGGLIFSIYEKRK